MSCSETITCQVRKGESVAAETAKKSIEEIFLSYCYY